MKNLSLYFRKKWKMLFNFAKRLDSSELESTKGYLEVRKSGNVPQYFIVTRDSQTKKKVRTYIRKEDKKMAENMAQFVYEQKAKIIINSQLKVIRDFIEKYDEDALDKLYYSLSKEKQALVTPIVPTKKMLIEAWDRETFQSKGFKAEDPEIYSNRGERVRSKSEKILADKFYAMGLYYKYEKPLLLDDGFRIFPDFTLLETDSLEEIYWEHFGMMDDPTYANMAVKRIGDYARNGIILGKNLLATFETSSRTLNDQYINLLIKNYLKF